VTDIAAALRSFEDEDKYFLAGMLFARGKFYIGRSARGRSHRFTPMVTLELSMELPVHFASLFEGPYERHYYAHRVLRYSLQSASAIGDLIRALTSTMDGVDMPNAEFEKRLKAMLAFCDAQTDDQRAVAYEQFNAVS
jgi:hypothetical protein